MEIKIENDYSKFSPIIGNRVINQAKVSKICADIESGFNMLQYCPIIVSESSGGGYSIIDGQHRFQVSVSTSQPVYFVVCNTLTLRQIAQMNSRGEKWKAADFLNCYVNLGIEDYKVLKEFMSEKKINLKLAIDLLMFYKHHESSTEIFQSGEFKVNFLEEAKDVIDLVDSLFNRYVFSHDRYLVGAIMKLKDIGKCDFNKLKQKISMAPNNMEKQADLKSFMSNIEKIYNFKNSIREVIY